MPLPSKHVNHFDQYETCGYCQCTGSNRPCPSKTALPHMSTPAPPLCTLHYKTDSYDHAEVSWYDNYHDNYMKGVYEHTKKSVHLHIIMQNTFSGRSMFHLLYVVCHGKCFFRLTLCCQWPVTCTENTQNYSLSSWLTLLSGLLWTHFTLDGYLGGDKASSLFPKYGSWTIAHKTTCFFLVTAPFFIDRKAKYFHILLLLEVSWVSRRRGNTPA